MGRAFYYDRKSALATTLENVSLFLSANFGLGNFAALQLASPNGLPGVLQLCARFTFGVSQSGL